MRIRKIIVGLVLFLSASLNAHAEGLALGGANLEDRIAALESLVFQLQSQINDYGAAIANNAQGVSGNSAAIANNAQGVSGNSAAISAADNVLQFASVVYGDLNGVTGPHFIIEGANVHVRSGAGSTGEGCFAGNATDPECGNRTGLGNLIVGYNEPRPSSWDPEYRCASDPDAQDPETGRSICVRRDGAHHLVVGQGNNFVGHGGTVMGLFNEAKGSHTTVTGGRENTASGPYASVSGGVQNNASRSSSSVSGGWGNRADGAASSVSGGENNVASGFISSVVAGQQNIASGSFSAVSGGNFNTAGGEAATVGGGNGNSAGGPWSTVSGGEANQANNFGSVVSGGRANASQGEISAVSGGSNNVAWGRSTSISGGVDKQAHTEGCTVGDNGADC